MALVPECAGDGELLDLLEDDPTWACFTLPTDGTLTGSA
jgi:hypothetical protein